MKRDAIRHPLRTSLSRESSSSANPDRGDPVPGTFKFFLIDHMWEFIITAIGGLAASAVMTYSSWLAVYTYETRWQTEAFRDVSRYPYEPVAPPVWPMILQLATTSILWLATLVAVIGGIAAVWAEISDRRRSNRQHSFMPQA